ncbi:YveK family protein [Chloroflexota bacterium]
MNLMEYVRIVLRRWWIIVLLMVLAMASAFLFSKAQTPVYRSNQKILMQPSRMDFGLAEAATRMMRSYVVYLASTDRAQEVIEVLQLDMVPGELLSKVTIDTDESRLLLTVDVDLENGELANQIARQWGTQFVEWRNEENQRTRYEDRIRAELVDTPVYGQIKPKITINILAAGILGLIVGGVIVFVLEYFESNIIRRRQDVERALDLPVLGAIPADDK